MGSREQWVKPCLWRPDASALWGLKKGDQPEQAIVDIQVPMQALGLEGVEDACAALMRVGHPGGTNERPLWKATHTRAIDDMAFHHWKRHGPVPKCVAFYGPVSRWTVADWMWTEEQMKTLKEYTERVETEIMEQDREW